MTKRTGSGHSDPLLSGPPGSVLSSLHEFVETGLECKGSTRDDAVCMSQTARAACELRCKRKVEERTMHTPREVGAMASLGAVRKRMCGVQQDVGHTLTGRKRIVGPACTGRRRRRSACERPAARSRGETQSARDRSVQWGQLHGSAGMCAVCQRPGGCETCREHASAGHRTPAAAAQDQKRQWSRRSTDRTTRGTAAPSQGNVRGREPATARVEHEVSCQSG